MEQLCSVNTHMLQVIPMHAHPHVLLVCDVRGQINNVSILVV